jgi:nucleoside-diphosphate-sugar epimerase
MKILITGGTGNVGRAAVTRLVKHGHDVTVIGRRADLVIEGGAYRQCDINDFPDLSGQMQGMEGVVHLAAIPHPSMAPGQEIFRVNCEGTFNVYRAAANAGIKRVVSASSINALGYNFGSKNFDIDYFPMDEEHPSFTTDPYSFSKQVMEEIGAYFWRREGISSVFLRLPAVFEMDGGPTARVRSFIDGVRVQTEALLALPEAARREQVAVIVAGFEDLRARRVWEQPDSWRSLREIPNTMAMFGRSNFWASIDARDSAQAIEKGLLADYEGSHPVYVNDSHNFAGIPTETLVAVFFPEVTVWKRLVTGTETLVSIDKVRTLLGFEPEYSISRWF